MVLTEEQALEIANICYPKANLQNRRHIFTDVSDNPNTFYSYKLFFITGRTFDGHRTSKDYLIFSFSDEYSQVTDDDELFKWNITEKVNKYLEEHKATAGV